MPKPNALTVDLVQFHDQHVIQDSTTTTVKDILPTVARVTHTLIVVDGGVGEDVVAQYTTDQVTMLIEEQEHIDQYPPVAQDTQDHLDPVHPFAVAVMLVKMVELVCSLIDAVV